MSFLIAIEGLDGSGKSTLADALSLAIQAEPSVFYSWVYQVKEPGRAVKLNSKINFKRPGPELRELVLTNADLSSFERELLFYADSSLHARFIKNQKNAIVISDRGKWSHQAYLQAYFKTKQIDSEDWLLSNQLISRICLEPDLVVYIDCDIETMRSRNALKTKDCIESNGDDFFSEVALAYTELVRQREWEGKPIISLKATDNLDKNIQNVVDYLKGVFHAEQLRCGDRELC